MAMTRLQFAEKKIKPAMDSLKNIFNPFVVSGVDENSLLPLQTEVSARMALGVDDSQITTTDDYSLEESLIRIAADLSRLRATIEQEEPSIDSEELGIKKFGERLGEKLKLFTNDEEKLVGGVFSGLASRANNSFPSLSVKIFSWGFRALYLVFLYLSMGVGFWAYVGLWWIMVAPRTTSEAQEAIDFQLLNASMLEQTNRAVISAIAQDGNFEEIRSDLATKITRISDSFDGTGLLKAEGIAYYLSSWDDAEQHLGETIFHPLASMARHINAYTESEDITELEKARSELNLVEDTVGYARVQKASDAVHERDAMQGLYNSSVDLKVANWSVEFREALSSEDWHLAAYYFGIDCVATEQEVIREHNERAEAEAQAAREQASIDAAAAAAAASAQSEPKKEGFLDNRRNVLGKQCKNAACGHMNGHLAYRCVKCGNFLGL